MDRELQRQWHQANIAWLMRAVSGIRRQLEAYIGEDKAGPAGEKKDPQSSAGRQDMPAPPAMDHLCAVLNLSPFERQTLLLCGGMAFLPDFPSLCAAAHGDPAMRYPTFSLAMELFKAAHWSAMMPRAPLRHWRLLQWETGQEVSRARLQIDEAVLHFLLGGGYTDPSLLPITPAPPVTTAVDEVSAPSHRAVAEQVAALLSGQDQGVAGYAVQLCGPDRTAKLAIAAQVVKTGQPLDLLSARDLPVGIEERDALLRRWERKHALTQALLVLDCHELQTEERELAFRISRWLADLKVPLIVTAEERIPSPYRPLVAIDVALPTREEQRSAWLTWIAPDLPERERRIEALVSQFNLDLPTIHSACLRAGNAGPDAPTPWQACRIMARPRLDELAQRIEPRTGWRDLVLPQRQRAILEELAIHVRRRHQVYQTWGFARKSSRGLGIGALFTGASGTGKTMAAEVLAREFELDLYRIDLSAVASKYIGETEKNLRRIFDAAESGGAILLFDEADALFGKRSEVRDSHDRYANVEISYLLQRMEAYQGLAILTTNMKSALDTAFLRRIRFLVTFPFPDEPARAEIWRGIFPGSAPLDDLDYRKLARLNLAGGNIRNIALKAMFLAAEEGQAVGMAHILAAAKGEYLKMEKTLSVAETRGWV